MFFTCITVHSYIILAVLSIIALHFASGAILFILSLANPNMKSMYLFFNHLLLNISNSVSQILGSWL